MTGDEPPRRPTPEERAARQKRTAAEGEVARRDYEAASLQTDEKTVRLRALRLERDRLSADVAAVAPKKKRSGATTTAKPRVRRKPS